MNCIRGAWYMAIFSQLPGSRWRVQFGAVTSAATLQQSLPKKCASAPWLDVPEHQVYELTGPAPDDPIPFHVVDERQDEEKLDKRDKTAIKVGDAHLSPAPPDAMRIELMRQIQRRGDSDRLLRMLQAQPVSLKGFELSITARDLRAEARSPAEGMMTALYQPWIGGSFVDVRLRVGIGDRTFVASSMGRLTASPSSFSVSRLFREAMASISAQIGASNGW